MRALLLLLALASAAFAASADDEALVRKLVAQLDAPSCVKRMEALRRLRKLGAAIRPILLHVEAKSPEARRDLEDLLHPAGSASVDLEAAPGAHDAGASLRLVATFVNRDSREVTVQYDSASTCLIAVEHANEKKPIRMLLPANIDPPPTGPPLLVIPAGERKVLTLVIPANAPELATPGSYRVQGVFHAWNGEPVGRGGIAGRGLSSRWIVLRVTARSVASLRAQLEKGGAEEASAVREILARHDKAVLPLLRELAKRPKYRERALGRLAAWKQPQAEAHFLAVACDVKAGRAARTRAIAALGSFDSKETRAKLYSLAMEDDFRDAAVAALARHPHAATIERFLALLQMRGDDGPWVRSIQKALLDWTGVYVRDTPGEVSDMCSWWRSHRSRWIAEHEKHATDK